MVSIRHAKKIRPLLFYRHVDDCFLMFHQKEDMLPFLDRMNTRHSNITFTHEEETNESLAFLDVLASVDVGGNLSTSFYHKPTFSSLYRRWDCYVPKQYKHGLVHFLIDCGWKICLSHQLFY